VDDSPRNKSSLKFSFLHEVIRQFIRSPSIINIRVNDFDFLSIVQIMLCIITTVNVPVTSYRIINFSLWIGPVSFF